MSSETSQSLPSASAAKVPPHVFFIVSAIFHYLGPALAVLLFAYVPPLGVAWLRNATAAVVFALWRRPWRHWRTFDQALRREVLALGTVIALMNATFYLAIDRLPLSTVAAIEFLGPIGLAAASIRTPRNFCALAVAIAGVYLLTEVRIEGEALGFALAFINCGLFTLYIVLGHRIARQGGGSGIDRLGIALLVAMLVGAPIGIADAATALIDPLLIAAGIGVGICSTVIPYVCDQLAMARLSRGTFALLLSLLPATATLIGVLVLRQVPSWAELMGITLVVIGVAVHREITT